MAEELSIDLKKPLEKMTAKELREVAMNQVKSVQGATGMDKDELLKAIKEALGITEEAGSVSPYKAQILSMKAKMRDLRAKKAAEGVARKEKTILRRKISRLKKRTRGMS